MLLQKLEAYADRIVDFPPRLYTNAPVRYIIELDGDGKFRELVDTADPSDRATKRGVWHEVPEVVKTSGISPFLLVGNAGYVLGFVGDAGKPPRVAKCHAAFMDLVNGCAVATGDPRVNAVLTFLREGPLEQIAGTDGFDSSARITFRIDHKFLVDLPAVQEFWAEENDRKNSKAAERRCLVCSRMRRVALTIEKVKGVPDGQMGGTSIISFNADAFRSFGLESSLNAPTCESCGARFTKSLNEMLRDPDHRVIVGGLAYVFWTREPEAEFSFATNITQPTAASVAQLLTAAKTGRQGAVAAIDDDSVQRFYATALSGSGGRAVVREWIDTSVAEAKQHLHEWFQLQRITDRGETGLPLSISKLSYATVRTGDRNNKPPINVTRSLLRTALRGDPVPWQLLFEAVRRCRAEQSVTRPRAALIKMVLLSQHPERGQENLVELDGTEGNAAYRCGRLLAVIEAVQRAAMPGVNATIVDRFYGTASSAPASVFGRLMRGVQPHLSKLERDRRGAWVSLQRQLEEVAGGLPLFPRTLTLEDQGMFALGYYHQRALPWGGKRATDSAAEPSDAAAGDEADDNSDSEQESN